MEFQTVQRITSEGEIPSEIERHPALEGIRRDAYTELLHQVSMNSLKFGYISIDRMIHWWFKGSEFDQCHEWSARRNGKT